MESGFVVKHLLTATDDQIEAIVTLADRAFGPNHLSIKAELGGDWSLHPMLLRAMLQAGLHEEAVYVVMNEGTGEIAAVALWFPPGKRLLGTEEQRELGFNEFLTKISDDARIWWTTTYVELVNDFRNTLFSEEETLRRWWYPLFTTDPKYQKKGFGRALVDFMYNKATDARGFLALAADREENVLKYISLGFKERGRTVADASTGAFSMICLTRGL